MPTPRARRRFLRGSGLVLGAALAGCSSGDSGDPTDGELTTDTAPRTTRTSTSTRTSETTVQVSPADFEFDVAVLDQFTKRSPARLRVDLGYEGNSEIRVMQGQTPPFSDYTGQRSEGNMGLHLIPDDREHLFARDAETGDMSQDSLVPEEPTGGCWTVMYELVAHDIAYAPRLNPGERIGQEYTVLDRNDGTCVPTGVYRFSEDQIVYGPDWDVEIPVTLGFAVTLDELRRITVEVDDPA